MPSGKEKTEEPVAGRDSNSETFLKLPGCNRTMKNFNYNDEPNWMNRLVYGTLMACTFAAVSLFAMEVIHFANSPRLAHWRERISAESDPALVENSTEKSDSATRTSTPVKTARPSTNAVKARART